MTPSGLALLEFEETLAESVHTLVVAGHAPKEIRRYSIRQVQGFVQLAHEREKAQRVWQASIHRAAAHLDGRKWKAFMKELEG